MLQPGDATNFLKLKTTKAVIVNMDKKSQIKPHNLCKFQQVSMTVQISFARPDDSIVISKAFILTWIDFTLGAKKVKRQQLT